MNYWKEITEDFTLKTVGSLVCVLTMLAQFLMLSCYGLLGGLFFLIFQIPVPLAALAIFRKAGKIGQIHAATLMIPYIILSIFFWIVAPGEASKDAQGALIFVFGPIYIAIICGVILGVFSFFHLIYRRIKEDQD